MTATEVLRRLLDECGVEWMDDSYAQLWCTVWYGQDGKQWRMTENRSGMLTELKAWHVTPEQAIAATLGATDARPTQAESSGTCHDVWDTELTGRLRFQCSECGAVSLEITPRFCPVCGARVVEPTTNDVDAEVEQ